MDPIEQALWGDESDGEPAPAALAPAALQVQLRIPSKPAHRVRQRESHRTRRRTTEERRRDEIHQLRGVAEYLARRLTQLQEQREFDRAMDVVLDDAYVAELLELQQAYEENQRLRLHLEEKSELAHAMKELVEHHSMQLAAVIPRSVDAPTDPPSRDVVDELMHALDTMYMQTDEILGNRGLTIAQPTFTKTDVSRQSSPRSSLSVHVHNSRLVPFDREATAAAVWQSTMGRSYRPHQGWIQQYPDGTLVSQFGAYIKLPKFEGPIRVTIGIRRIVEENHVVILRCGLVTYLDPCPAHQLKNRSKRPLHSRMFTWSKISSPLHPRFSSHDALSQVQNSSLSVLALRDNEHEAEVAAMTSFCVNVGRQFSIEAENQVDGLLLTKSNVPISI